MSSRRPYQGEHSPSGKSMIQSTVSPPVKELQAHWVCPMGFSSSSFPNARGGPLYDTEFMEKGQGVVSFVILSFEMVSDFLFFRE